MSSNKNKKRLIRTILTANGTCGCAKKKAIEVHEPTPKTKTSIHSKTNSNSSKDSSTTTSGERNGGVIDDDDFSSTATFSEAETASLNNKLRSPLMNTVAVEKDSEDPYHDFRHSMLQMIFEKEIHSGDDLHDLLQCFLHLNATCYHSVIVKAFNDICQESFPDKVSSAVPPATTETETETETETSMTATTSSSESVNE